MSEFIQESFIGGMNLLLDDTRLQKNQYVAGFNIRNRNDQLDNVLESQIDIAIPPGIKQGILTFGNYVIAFISGKAYYRYYLNTGWTQIDGFAMSVDAPRYWYVNVPVATTLYGRVGQLASTNQSGSSVLTSSVDPQAAIVRTNSIIAMSQGNNPGLLVQDNLNQPQFIFLAPSGLPVCRTTQDYNGWSITLDPATLLVTEDKREYVPIGNAMAWVDGILYIASQDGNWILRSVSGRPLDFVLNVDEEGQKAGNAYTTAYSVGVGGITCLREMGGQTLFVSASGANFLVSKNMTEGSPRIFGEYDFVKKFLFNATCLSDRVIFDTEGDTRFIDLTGVRSFNGILQEQNEGKNSVFTSTIQKALTKLPSASEDLVQSPLYSAAILYDNYELYAVQTIFGPAIAVYDTIAGCWTSFDTEQTGGQRIKQFAKIESTIQRLYAITENNQLYTLYIGPNKTTGTVRTLAIANKEMSGGEIKLSNVRCVLDELTRNETITVTPFVNNRLTAAQSQSKSVPYAEPPYAYTSNLTLPDIGTQLKHLLFTFQNTGQGWKCFCHISWTGGSLVQYSMEFTDNTPTNPPLSQS